MAPWVAVVEAWLVKQLLESRTFHQGVRRVHKGVHRLRHGPLEGDEGGTNIEKQGPGFGHHLWDEIQTQAGLRKKVEDPLQKSDPTQPQQPKPSQPAQDPKQPKESFVNHFLNELLTQTKGGDKK